MSAQMTIGIYSPGAMGSALGRAWRDGGSRVVSTVAGRSARTTSLAEGLELLPSLPDVVATADIVISIGPPAHAGQMAAAIAAACRERECRPLVADLNAVGPSTVDLLATELDSAGCELLDGSISGGPPTATGDTRLYLSGPSAHRLADLAAPGITPHIVGGTIGLASAVKMCTAAMYKGFAALLLQSLQTAHAFGVTDVVLDDLGEGFGELVAGSPARIASAAAKADRYAGEMLEIAATQGQAGAQAVLFEAMAQVYQSVALTRLAALSPEDARHVRDLAMVLNDLVAR